MASLELSALVEADGPCGSWASPVDAVNHDTAEQRGSSGIYSPRRCDPYAIRRKFPAKWMGFLHAHFRDAVEVAYFFSVDAKTARLWWEGSTGPQGWAVDFARQTFPDARQWMEAA